MGRVRMLGLPLFADQSDVAEDAGDVAFGRPCGFPQSDRSEGVKVEPADYVLSEEVRDCEHGRVGFTRGRVHWVKPQAGDDPAGEALWDCRPRPRAVSGLVGVAFARRDVDDSGVKQSRLGRPCSLVVNGTRSGGSGCSRRVAAISCSRPASIWVLVSRSGDVPASAATVGTTHHCNAADF
jgi:hypothetical protein